MAAELVKTGKLTVKGDGIDAQLDFGRDKSLNISLSGNNTWASPEFKMREFLNKRRSNMASKNRRNTSPNIAWISELVTGSFSVPIGGAGLLHSWPHKRKSGRLQ